MRIAHVVSESIGPEHLRVLQVLLRAGAEGAIAIVDHGSGQRRWLLGAGILAHEAALTHAPSRLMPAFNGLAELLWQNDLDAVHIHGGDVAATALAAARWLDLPVIYTPAADMPAAPRLRLFGGLFGRDPLRGADGLLLLPGADPLEAAGRPVLRIETGAPAEQINRHYRDLLEEIDRRIGREPSGAGRHADVQVA